MPVTRVLFTLFALAAFSLPAAPAASQPGCETITEPNTDPPPSEIVVEVVCPGDDDSGSDPVDGTPVGGGGGGAEGGGGGPVCLPTAVSDGGTGDIDLRPDGTSWHYIEYACDDGTTGGYWRCSNCSSGGEDDDAPVEIDWSEVTDGLVLEAAASLEVPAVGLRHNFDSRPDGEVLGVVRAETWWWTETLDPVTSSATSGPLRVDVTATPTVLEIDPGDGSPVVSCPDGGAVYDFGASYYDQVGGSSCIHVFEQTSADEPGEAFTVTATVRWDVAWLASGPVALSGELPADAASETVPLPVGEIQSVIRS